MNLLNILPFASDGESLLTASTMLYAALVMMILYCFLGNKQRKQKPFPLMKLFVVQFV
jgi:hypothetical protein